MNELTKLPEESADAINFIHGLVTDKGSVPALFASGLKGLRDGNFKENLFETIIVISEKSNSKLKEFTIDETYEFYDDIINIFDQIEHGIGPKKFDAIKTLFSKTLTEDEKDRIYTRKLIEIVNNLTEDDLLVFKVIATDEHKIQGTTERSKTKAIIGQLSGLKSEIFVQKALENLKANDLVTEYVLAKGYDTLTELGKDLYSLAFGK